MSERWRCGVCEHVTDGGRTCPSCGAVLSLRSVVTGAVRDELDSRTGLLPGERLVRALLRRGLRRVLAPRE